MPVIALTAQAMAGDAERCLDAGMDGYVAKPIDIDELERAIARTRAGAVPPPTLNDSEPYDRVVLERRVGRDPALFAELCKLFEPRSEILLSQIKDALESHDFARIRTAAHELKGMLLNLAATDASRTARRLEAAGQDAQYNEASECATRLAYEVPQLLAALRTLSSPSTSLAQRASPRDTSV